MQVSFAGGEIHSSSFAGGPHVNDGIGRNGGGSNGHHISKVNPPIHLPPPPPIKAGKTPVVNIILGVASSKCGSSINDVTNSFTYCELILWVNEKRDFCGLYFARAVYTLPSVSLNAQDLCLSATQNYVKKLSCC